MRGSDVCRYLVSRLDDKFKKAVHSTNLEGVEVPLHRVLVDTAAAPTIVAVVSISRAVAVVIGLDVYLP